MGFKWVYPPTQKKLCICPGVLTLPGLHIFTPRLHTFTAGQHCDNTDTEEQRLHLHTHTNNNNTWSTMHLHHKSQVTTTANGSGTAPRTQKAHVLILGRFNLKQATVNPTVTKLAKQALQSLKLYQKLTKLTGSQTKSFSPKYLPSLLHTALIALFN